MDDWSVQELGTKDGRPSVCGGEISIFLAELAIRTCRQLSSSGRSPKQRVARFRRRLRGHLTFLESIHLPDTSLYLLRRAVLIRSILADMQ